MSQSYTIGWVTKDLELQKSAKGVAYVRFSLAERIGSGERFRIQYLQVWAFGSDAESLITAGIGKGSHLWVAGQLTLEAYEKMDMTQDKRLKVILDRWGHVPQGKPQAGETVRDGCNADGDSPKSGQPVLVIDGDREELPG